MKTLFALVLTLALLTSAALATQLSPVAEGQEASDFEVTLTDGTTSGPLGARLAWRRCPTCKSSARTMPIPSSCWA